MITSSVGLKTHIWNNNLRCIVLLCIYPLLLAAMVWAVGWAIGMSLARQSYTNVYNVYSDPASSGYIKPAGTALNTDESITFANQLVLTYWPIILSVVMIWFIIAWFFNTQMIRKLAHSRSVTREEEPELYNLLENLCISQGIKTPRLEIIETHACNAFASGIDTNSYSITVTRGLVNSLARDELEGVLAHELTHILNRDVRLLIVTVIFTGMFGFAAQLAWSSLRQNIFYTRGRRNNQGNAVFVIFGIAIILWLGYMATLFMRFALSRHREFMADAGAVEMTKNPEAMIRALMRISGRDRIPQTTDDIAMMCIENHVPFLGLFATHPPIQKRILAISKFTNTPVPPETSLAPARQNERLSPQNLENKRENPWLTRQRRS